MVGVRCQWYDDDGTPVQDNGCRFENTSCTFVHPTSPNWSSATRRKLATFRGRGRGRGRGGATSHESLSRDNGWNSRRQSANNADWDVEGWRPKSTHPDPTLSPVSSTSQSSQWGSRSASKSGWGTAAVSGSGEWGSGSGGWGATTTTGQGNGDTASKVETTAAITSGWGTSSGWGTGGWGESTGGWGTGGGWEPAATAGETTTTSGWGPVNAGESSNTASVSNPIATPDRPVAQPSRPTDLQLETDNMTVDAPSHSASSHRGASQAPSERTVCPTPQSAFPPFTVPASASIQTMNRSQLHSGIIKNSVRATRIRLELQELQHQLAEWKTTQHSQLFHRVSTESGNHLDSIKTKLLLQISLVEDRLKQAEDELLRYPDLSSSAPNIVEVDKEMMAYTDQLTAWLQSFAAIAVPPIKPAPASLISDYFAMDVDSESTLELPLSLFAEVEERIMKLEEKLVEAEQMIQDPDLVSPEKNAAHIDKALLARTNRQQDGDQSKAARGTGSDDLQSTLDQLDSNMPLQADQVVLLEDKIALGKKRIEMLEAQREQRHSLKLAMQSQLEQFETWKQERRRQLAVMTEQLARLATQQPDTTPVLDDAVLLRVRATVDTMIQTEVVPALEALRVQYADAIERRVKSLQLSIQPALDKTKEICQHAELVSA